MILRAFVFSLIILSFNFAMAKPRVLVVGWDGARGDIVDHLVFSENRLPNLSELMNQGSFSRCSSVKDINCAKAHQSPKTIEKAEWMTAAGWASVITGKEPKYHKVFSNKKKYLAKFSDTSKKFPSFFMKAKQSGLATAAGGVGAFMTSVDGSGVYWGVVDYECGSSNKKSVIPVDGESSCNLDNRMSLLSQDDERDEKLKDWMVDQIENSTTDLIMGVFDRVDEAGHGSGFGLNTDYMQAFEKADEHLGEVLASLRKTSKKDDWLIVLTSDHGGHTAMFWGAHGKKEGEDEVIPLVVSTMGSKKWKGSPLKFHTEVHKEVINWLEIQ